MELDEIVTLLRDSVHTAAQFAQQNPVAVASTAALLAAASIVPCALKSRRYAGVPYSVQVPAECEPGWQGKILENPSIRSAASNDIQCYCPANGRLLGHVTPASRADIDAAIARSAKAQKAWAQTSFDDRKKVLRTLLGYILANQDAIVQAACLDSGKTRVDAVLGEILVTTEKIKWVLDYGAQALAPEKRPTSFMMIYKKAEVRYDPLGVVFKGSENTAWSSNYFVSIVKGALSACGHDPDLVQSIMCWPDVAPYLTSHHGIAHITFIGSRPVAHHVAASAAKTLTPLCIELGGKDAHIILDDYKNLESLSSVLMRGVFQSSSQNCVGIERIIVLPRIYDKLVAILERRIKLMRPGSALEDTEVDMGAMISPVCFDRLEALIAQAVSKGARCLVGGKRFNHPKYPKGHYFSPTLLVDVTRDMDIAQNETFAPICVVMAASDVDDAIEIANSSEFGLGGSVYGVDRAKLEKVVRGMKCGMVAVNDFAVFYLNQSLPFGGVKGSGYGRFAGAEGLRAVCNPKSVVVDRWPSLIGTSIPPVVDYPINRPDKSYGFTKGLVEFAYGQGLKEKAVGIAKLLGSM
ncbi:Aldehyde/histidinol dehydrogenase [Peziza echinospora]|nr:Aldehyde/histidinol dehydrogenase [Peziza echinospora]